MIIDFLLDGYWTSSETKEYVDAAVSGISLDEYWTSAETKDYVDTAIADIDLTDIENHIDTLEEVTSRALNDLNDRVNEISGSTGGSVDLSAYWTSAQTKDYVDNAVSGITVDLSDYYTSGQTDAAIAAATANLVTSGDVATQIDEALSGFSSDAHILKAIDADNFPEAEIGDLVTTYGLDPEENFEWQISADDPDLKDIVVGDSVIDNKIISKLIYVEANTALVDEEPDISSNPYWDGFEFWFGTSPKYGEGDTYRCYWNSINEELAIETISAETPIEFNLIPDGIEWKICINGVADYFLVSPNSSEKSDLGKWVNTIGVETLQDAEDYLYITKANDVCFMEYYGVAKSYDGPYVYTGEENGWQLIPTYMDVEDMVTNKVSSSTISTIWTGTQADYDLIDTPDPNTFYVITGTTA